MQKGIEVETEKPADKRLQISLDNRPAAQIEADALVSYFFESSGDQEKLIEGVLAKLDQPAGAQQSGVLARLAASAYPSLSLCPPFSRSSVGRPVEGSCGCCGCECCW